MIGSDDPERAARVSSAGSEFERQLIRSARLDRLVPSAVRRNVEATLSAATSTRLARERRKRLWFALGLAAAFVVVASVQRRARTVQLSPEPQPVPAVALAPSAHATAPTLPPCPKLVVAQGGSALIDDLEDRNARILVRDGRFGTWQSTGDSAAKQTPRAGQLAFPVSIPGGRGDSRYALHAFGGQLSAPGSGLIVYFAPGYCYDAAKYAGVEFWARGKGRIHLGFTMVDVMASEWGGLCKKDCYDRHRKPFDLESRWVRYAVRWEELRQFGWGSPLAFDPQRLLSLDFMVDFADTPYDYWVDDVRFIEP